MGRARVVFSAWRKVIVTTTYVSKVIIGELCESCLPKKTEVQNESGAHFHQRIRPIKAIYDAAQEAIDES